MSDSSIIKLDDIQTVTTITDGDARPEALRSGVKKIIEAGGKMEILAAELLFEIREKDYWKKYTYTLKGGEPKMYTSFDEFLANEVEGSEGSFGFSKRKAFYLMRIYEKFVRELKVPIEILRGIEWSKAKEIVEVISESNWKDLINILPKVSVKDLKEIVDTLSGKATIKETKETVKPLALPKPVVTPPVVMETPTGDGLVKIEFHLFEAQAKNLREALELASYETGSESKGNNIDMIATEFLASRSVTPEDTGGVDPRVFALCSRMDRHLQNFERVFKVKLNIDTAIPDGTTAEKA